MPDGVSEDRNRLRFCAYRHDCGTLAPLRGLRRGRFLGTDRLVGEKY
jgi:hypothetical protein